MYRLMRAAVLAVATICVACASGAVGETGDVSLTTTVRSAISGGQKIPVSTVWVHVFGTTSKGQAVDQWYRAIGTSGQYVLTLSKVAIGTYLAHGRAYSSATAVPTDVPDFESVGDAGFVVTSKATTPVTLTLQQNTARWPPDQVDNFAPVVDSLMASTSTVDSSASATPITLRATASDPDGPDDLAGHVWTAAYAPPVTTPGPFDSPELLQTLWTPPPGYEGTVTFTFTVSDKKFARSSVSMSLLVSKSFGSGSATIAIELNHSPDVLGLTTTDGQLSPGETTQFTVVAVDPDGDDLHYAWDDGACGGTFGSPDQPTTTYQATFAELACPITATVSDFRAVSPFDARGASTLSTLTVNVVRLPPQFAPEFVYSAWSGAAGVPYPPGSPMRFFVDAIQREGTPPVAVPAVDYWWDDRLGGDFDPLSGTDYRRVSWAVPGCGGETAPYVVNVTVWAIGSVASGGLTTPLTFPVTVACP
jgi:hypothetical protein